VPAAIFLVGLAALQGLLVVAGLSFMHQPQRARSVLPSASTSSSLSSALASPSGEQPPSVVPAVPLGSAAPSSIAAVPVAVAPSATALPDESGLQAPSCDQVLSATPVKPGDYPGAAYGEMREADKALVRGDVDAAQRSLCKAALWDQKNPAIPLEVAQLMLLRRDGGKAVEWANRALELDPESQRAAGVLGDGLARLGQYEPAKLAWLKSMRLEPADEARFKSLAFSSLREAQASLTRRDFARAERFYRRAVVLDGDNTQASNGLANALLKLGDTSSALRWANHSVASAPRDATARLVLGDVLFKKGDRNAAEVEWREALQLEPGNFLAKLRLDRLRNTR
jgi:tetratricopeptide (TPR) repeat protein